MTQKKRKRKKRLFPELGTTSRLTVPGQHSLPSTPKSRPKGRVETSGDPWDVSQPPGSLQPAYGSPPTADKWYLHLALPRRTASACQSRDVPLENGAPGSRQGGKNSRGFFGWLVVFGLNDPLRQYFSLYRVVSQREGEREEKG